MEVVRLFSCISCTLERSIVLRTKAGGWRAKQGLNPSFLFLLLDTTGFFWPGQNSQQRRHAQNSGLVCFAILNLPRVWSQENFRICSVHAVLIMFSWGMNVVVGVSLVGFWAHALSLYGRMLVFFT